MCCRKSALVVVGQFEGKSLSANVPQIPRLVTDQCLRRGISTAIAFPDEGKSGFALPADNEAQSNESQWGLTALRQQRNIVSRQPLCTGSHSTRLHRAPQGYTRLHKTPQASTRLHKTPQASTSRSAKVALLSSSLSWVMTPSGIWLLGRDRDPGFHDAELLPFLERDFITFLHGSGLPCRDLSFQSKSPIEIC